MENDYHDDHVADWRVNPNQVLKVEGNSVEMHVVCARCLCQAYRTSIRHPTPDPSNVLTWPRWTPVI